MPLTRNIIIHSQQSHHQNGKIIDPSSDLFVVPGYFILLDSYYRWYVLSVGRKRSIYGTVVWYFIFYKYLCLYVESVGFRCKPEKFSLYQMTNTVTLQYNRTRGRNVRKRKDSVVELFS